MKTSFTCLGILIAALVLGRCQSTRIAEIEQQIATSQDDPLSQRHTRERTSPEPSYRTKYERKSTHARADDVFESLLKFRAARTSVFAGPMVRTAVENKEAFQAIMQLDLPNLEALIQMIAKSNDPVFQREVLVRCEQIVLCLTAIADIDPGRALELICDSKEQIGPFFADIMWAPPLLEYVLTRLSDPDPQRALDALIRITQETPEMMSVENHQVKVLLGVIARSDPGLVLETIQKFPETTRPGMVESLADQLESDDEYVALFHASRERSGSQAETMERIIHSICRRFSDTSVPASETIALINLLKLTDEEKPLIRNALQSANVPEIGRQEFAKWAADFFPDPVDP